MKVLWTSLAGILITGCGGAESVTVPNCGESSGPAITVTLLDARSDEPVQNQAFVVARDGAYADTSRGVEPGFPTYALAYDRPGAYTVTVNASGYQQWQRGPFIVSQTPCGVSTIPLAAHLIRQ